jgi:hypothetical protein
MICLKKLCPNLENTTRTYFSRILVSALLDRKILKYYLPSSRENVA